jgi:hypothetical protein
LSPVAPYRKNPDVSWRAIEGQAVLVHNRLGEILVLNEVGTFIWERIDLAPEDVAAQIAREFSVSFETASADLRDFIQQLQESEALLAGE